MLCLFGIPLLISAQRNIVDVNDCIASDIYIYVTYSIEAIQGIFMSLIFCYLNPDVSSIYSLKPRIIIKFYDILGYL